MRCIKCNCTLEAAAKRGAFFKRVKPIGASNPFQCSDGCGRKLKLAAVDGRNVLEPAKDVAEMILDAMEYPTSIGDSSPCDVGGGD